MVSTSYNVKMADLEAPAFKAVNGLRECGPLSPILFNIVSKKIIR